MGTSRNDISQWFDQGLQDKALFMIVATDTFDCSDYPCYCMTAEKALSEYKRINEADMSKVMEVYDLSADKAGQMAETRAWRLPKAPGPIGSMDALAASFEAHHESHCKFEEIHNPPSRRPDLVAFMLLDSLVPAALTGDDMVSGTSHDEIFLGVDCEALSKVITDAQVKDLRRCGVRFDSPHSCLSMFL